MTSSDSSHRQTNGLRIWLEAGAVWVILLVLFGVNVYLTYVPLGGVNIVVHISLAITMILLLVVFFMDFRRYTALLRIAVVAGVFWLIIMFALTGTDYFTRALY